MSIAPGDPPYHHPPAAFPSRWGLVPLLLTMTACAHFNRISMSVAGAEAIIPFQGIAATDMGWVYSAYLFFYTLAMSPGGWFIDRFGARTALLIVAVGSAVFMALTALAGFLWSGAMLLIALLAIRSVMGIANAPTHPGAARLVGDWIAPRQQSLVNGMVNFAACIGIASTYLAFGRLIDWVDWPTAALISGGATLALALVWMLCADNTPAPFARPPHAERTISVARLLRSRSLVALTLSYGALGYFQYLFFYWAEYYFEHVRELPRADGRWYTSVLTVAMGLGMIAGGWLTDWTRHRVAHPRIFALVPAAGLVVAAAALVPGVLSEHALVTLACFALAMAAAGSCEGAFWTLAVEIGGARGGLAAAILNTGGNAGGLIAPVLTPYLSALFGWQAGLGFASIVCVLGAACWLFIDPHAHLEIAGDASNNTCKPQDERPDSWR